VLHAHRPHLPHPHVHPGFDEHPWRMVPVTLGTIVLLAALLITVCFVVAKAFAGQAY
jgi:hypothetical protein